MFTNISLHGKKYNMIASPYVQDNFFWAKAEGSVVFDRFDDKLNTTSNGCLTNCDGTQWVFSPYNSLYADGVSTYPEEFSKGKVTLKNDTLDIFDNVTIKYDGTNYVALAPDGFLFTCTDLLSWIGRWTKYVTSSVFADFAWDGSGKWCVVWQQNGTVVDVSTATDPTGTWTDTRIIDEPSVAHGPPKITHNGSGTWAITYKDYTNGQIKVYSSSNATSWTLEKSITTSTAPTNIVNANGLWVIATPDGTYDSTTIDGTYTWRSFPSLRICHSVTFFENNWWVCGFEDAATDQPWIAYSSDLTSWTAVELSLPADVPGRIPITRLTPFENRYE